MNWNDQNDIVEQWREQAGDENPAGPLYISGEYAESDIASDRNRATMFTFCGCGTACTGSHQFQCC